MPDESEDRAPYGADDHAGHDDAHPSRSSAEHSHQYCDEQSEPRSGRPAGQRSPALRHSAADHFDSHYAMADDLQVLYRKAGIGQVVDGALACL